MDGLNVDTLPNPYDRYKLGECLGSGVFAQVYKANDKQAGGKSVAAKVRRLDADTAKSIREEYKILRDFTSHPNILDFYGIFCENISGGCRKIWFILELCEGGSVSDMVCKLLAMEKKLKEEHIAFILKETVKALIFLHGKKIIHRNIRCSNILLTRDGEVKLSDFGISGQLTGTLGKRITSIGSPAWMAPEVVTIDDGPYGNRSDVWALGISTIEMADGRAPYQNMHPTRTLFQIARNPPPTFTKPSLWSNEINDFVNECLEKNPEYRPYVTELVEHPFIQSVPENDYFLSQELKKIILDVSNRPALEKPQERIVRNGLLMSAAQLEPEVMHVEDLAALEPLSEDAILQELETKLIKGLSTSFVGDVLVIVNPNVHEDIYSEGYHKKYQFQSRSDNAPHIFTVADSAYQDALHHKEPQHIVFSGESGSGKTTNMMHAVKHLAYLGQMKNNTGDRIEKALQVIQTATHGSTLINANSTRCVFQTQMTFSSSGKLSGAIFWIYQLEKWKISTTDMTHANFNLVYYFYDGMEAERQLAQYELDRGRKYRYLRILEEPPKITGARDNPMHNLDHFKAFEQNLLDLEFDEEELISLRRILAGILILGNVRFKEGKQGAAELENPEEVAKVSKLLQLDEKKLTWALVKYCLIARGSAVKRNHSCDEARDARDVLAATIYRRLIDWIVNAINYNLSFGRSVFGDTYSVSLLDLFGFECFHRNRLEQLIVNTMNEQLQFLYNQRMFAWEMQEQEEEQVPVISLHFYDNKPAVDQLMSRPLGLFYIIDEASHTSGGQEYIMSTIKNSAKGPYLKLAGSHEFSVAHFTGKINYDARDMAEKNRDFLPPEMIETLRLSTNFIVQHLFTSKLTKTGNVTVPASQPKIGDNKARRYNTASKGQHSQLHRMRTVSTTFRATSLEILKQLSIGADSAGIHFVRCIRADLLNRCGSFQADVVRQQLRGMAILDTAKARQKGFSSRIPFSEFIKRYKFLAFDFDENVEITKENCRLLLIRLKMEGWLIGKTKVFLKYYNEEYLARMYEVQVKKIVKVQCMMRAYLARKKAAKSKSKVNHTKELQKQQSKSLNQDEAAVAIQKAYRGYSVRKAYTPLINKSTGQIDEETANFIRRFAMKWKSRSIFQVLLQYRAVRYQDLVNLTQQVHIYNQFCMEGLIATSDSVSLGKINPQSRITEFLGSKPPTVQKIPFRMDLIQYFDTTYLCDNSTRNRDTLAGPDSDQETWDEPLRRKSTTASQIRASIQNVNYTPAKQTQPIYPAAHNLIHTPYSRDPAQPIKKLPPQAGDGTYGKPRATIDYTNHSPSPYTKRQSPSIVKYQAPTPWTSQKDSQNNIDNKNVYSGVIRNNMNNPIRELQEFGRTVESSERDDPPFNFQAMLRKTPRNRESMKRVGESSVSLKIDTFDTPSHRKRPAPPPPKSYREIKPIKSSERSNYPVYVNHLKEESDQLIKLLPGLRMEGTAIDV